MHFFFFKLADKCAVTVRIQDDKSIGATPEQFFHDVYFIELFSGRAKDREFQFMLGTIAVDPVHDLSGVFRKNGVVVASCADQNAEIGQARGKVAQFKTSLGCQFLDFTSAFVADFRRVIKSPTYGRCANAQFFCKREDGGFFINYRSVVPECKKSTQSLRVNPKIFF